MLPSSKLTHSSFYTQVVVVRGPFGVAGALGQPHALASNGVVYHTDALPLPAPSVATQTAIAALHIQLLMTQPLVPHAPDTCALEDSAVDAAPTSPVMLWVVMGLLADLLLTVVLVVRVPMRGTALDNDMLLPATAPST